MRKRTLGCLIATTVLVTSANAQLAGLLGKSFGLPANGEVGGSYQSGNRIRTYVSYTPYDADLLYRMLVAKATDMARAKGFTRIGVTKTKCMTAVISGSPRSMSCYLIAVMLNDGEVADPRGSRDIRYHNVEGVSRAR